jgi:4a-hydroxytetrahydrobiopterin dehydratase
MTERITPRQFHEAVGVEDWRVLGEGACTYLRTGSFPAGARLVQAISELDEPRLSRCQSRCQVSQSLV